MATKTQTIVTVESDLSGETEASTVPFALDGVSYEIDLTEVEHKDFAELFEKYIKAARRSTSKTKTARRAVPEMTPEQREEIRKWLLENGVEVTNRGRIPKRGLRAWNESHPERQFTL